MYQKILLIGNLGNDPEQRFTPAGIPVTTFSMAVNKSWTDADGQRKDKTTWYRVTCWRKLAETTATYLKKGAKVMVEGEDLEARAWTDRDGAQRASLELTASAVRFLDSKADSAGNGASAPAEPQPQATKVRAEDEIPF